MTRVTSKPWIAFFRRSQTRHFLLGLLGVVIGLAVWLALVYFRLVPKYALPSPGALVLLWHSESPR